MTLPTTPTREEGGESFQHRVQPWMMACFGAEISSDCLERCDRFIEEALELVQAMDYSPERAHALVEYVFGRPAGSPSQEVGGVMVTLAALCLAADLDMNESGETELARVWTKVEQIRAKQAAKPRGSALPIAVNSHSTLTSETARLRERVRVLEEALRPFADLGVGSGSDYEVDSQPYRILRGAIRLARSALHTPEVGG